MLSVEVAHPSTEAASDQPEEVGPSVTLPPSLRTAQQEESPEVRGSAFNAQQTPRPSHQTRTIACQASLRAAKVGPACGCGWGIKTEFSSNVYRNDEMVVA